MRNLLENARRYGAGSISLSLSQTPECAVIRVADRGPGVPPELQERIFEPFYRLPGATERDGGVGLGLALVKSIALRHGGVLIVKAVPAEVPALSLNCPSTQVQTCDGCGQDGFFSKIGFKIPQMGDTQMHL